MSYRSFVYQNVFFVRWTEVTLAEIDDVLARARLVKNSQPKPVIYAGLQFDDYIDPPPEVRKGAFPTARELAATVGWYYVAICASGVRATLQRTLLRGVLMTARAAGYDTKAVRVVDGVDAILRERERELPCSIDELRQRLESAGMTR